MVLGVSPWVELPYWEKGIVVEVLKKELPRDSKWRQHRGPASRGSARLCVVKDGKDSVGIARTSGHLDVFKKVRPLWGVLSVLHNKGGKVRWKRACGPIMCPKKKKVKLFGGTGVMR